MMNRRYLTALFLSLLLGVFDVAIARAQTPAPNFKDVDMRVRLLAPLSTKLSRKGDLVSAAVVEPATYEGAILEGDVREIKGGPSQKTAAVQFQFHTLHLAGKAVPLNIAVLNVANSKQQLGVDDEGTQLESDKGALATGKSSSLGSTLGKFRLGGSKATGGSGAFRLQTHASNLTLAVGSEMVVQANSKAGRE
jgi:hypothetical protein